METSSGETPRSVAVAGSYHETCNTAPGGTVTRVTNCKVEWMVKDFFNLQSAPVYSECFVFCSFSCRLKMLPYSTAKQNYLTMILEVMSTLTDAHRVVTTFGIKKSDGSEFDCIFENLEFSRDVFSNRAGMIERAPILESKSTWAPDDNLTIICNLGHDRGGFLENAALPTSILSNDLENLFLDARDTDVIMNVQGVQFKAHRLILSARSPVFATMFLHDMAERQRGVVDIDDCDQDSFQNFLLYLYTGKTDYVIPDKASGLYSTADKYSVLDLKKTCVKCMQFGLSVDTVCDTLLLASAHGESELLEGAKNFFVRNIKEVVQTQKWDDFQSQNLTLVKDLLIKSADFIKI